MVWDGSRSTNEQSQTKAATETVIFKFIGIMSQVFCKVFIFKTTTKKCARLYFSRCLFSVVFLESVFKEYLKAFRKFPKILNFRTIYESIQNLRIFMFGNTEFARLSLPGEYPAVVISATGGNLEIPVPHRRGIRTVVWFREDLP